MLGDSTLESLIPKTAVEDRIRWGASSTTDGM